MRSLLAIMAVLIFYGSVYPLNFSTYTYTPERMAQLVDFSLAGGLTGNAIANILLFIPYSFLSVFAHGGTGRARGWQIALLTVAGLALAYAAQFAQVFIVGRVPSGVDVLWNVLGMLAGLLAGFAVAASRHRLPALAGPLPIPLLLVGGWVAYQWIPFVPTLDLGLLRDNAVSLIAKRTPSPFWVFQNTLLWLMCYQLLERYAPAIRRVWYPLATLLVLVSGGLFIGSTVNVDDFAGALCALILWRALDGRWYPQVLALLLVAAIVGASYLSLTLRETPASFSWIPFSGSLGTNVVLNVIATWKKLVLYGLLIWLLLEARLSLTVATLVTAALLFVSEWFQVYIQGATPEITDALLALMTGSVFALWRQRPPRPARDNSRASPVPGRRRRSGLALAGISVALAAGVGVWSMLPPGPAAAIRGEVAWAGQRAHLIADLHTHTRISDGSLTAADLVADAVGAGCDVLAITDHSDSSATGGAAQRDAIATLRREYPDLLLFLGMELELPSYAGREHMNVLLHPDQEAAWLPKLRRAVDEASDGERGTAQDPDRDFLRLINRIRDAGHPAFLIYNHPSRKVANVTESLDDLRRWRSLGTSINAMAGAPGHQYADTIGAYRATVLTDNRWDPATASVGGVWDQYLASGKDLWAALASSDFHDAGNDASPCAFSRIHIAAPERSYAGVLEALIKGTFWADHGRLLDQLTLEVEFDGIARALFPGESADVFTDDSVALARVVIERGPGSAGSPLEVAFISSCVDGESQIVAQQWLASDQSVAERLIPLQASSPQDNSCHIRARVSLDKFGREPDLLAYTNYVRVNLRLGVLDGHMLDWRLE